MIAEYVKVNDIFGEDHKKAEEKAQDRILKEKKKKTHPFKESEEKKTNSVD